MPVSSNIRTQSKTIGVVNSTSSQEWLMQLLLDHSTGTETTSLADLELYLAINHYWLPYAANGLTFDIYNAGTPFGTTSGTVGTAVIEVISCDNSTDKPIIYPIGVNARLNTILKLTWPTSTLTWSGVENGLEDIQFSTRDSNYKTTKYYSATTPTDLEDSYSYRDNAGAAETVYADNEKMWVIDSSTGTETVRWGNPPIWDPQATIVIEPSNLSTIDENTPTVSYETDTSASVMPGTGSSKNAIFNGIDPSALNFGSILRAEVILSHTGASYLSPSTVDLMDLAAISDPTPIWNEVTPNRNEIIASRSVDEGHTISTWMFDGSSLETLLTTWLNNWNVNHKGFAIKFNDETTTNAEQFFGSDNNTEVCLRPYIIITYSKTVATGRRRIIIV
jgi:hypothetical protein